MYIIWPHDSSLFGYNIICYINLFYVPLFQCIHILFIRCVAISTYMYYVVGLILILTHFYNKKKIITLESLCKYIYGVSCNASQD